MNWIYQEDISICVNSLNRLENKSKLNLSSGFKFENTALLEIVQNN